MAFMRVEELRNGICEATHEIALYSAARGWLTEASWTDALPTRSTAKPLLLALSLDAVGMSADRFSSAELAVMSSSHNGEGRHRRLLLSLLASAGLDPSDLHLGTHPRIVPGEGLSVMTETPLSHNCSGKHVSSLLVQQGEGFNGSYLDPSRPLFTYIQKRLEEAVGRQVALVVDGCGYPTPCLSVPELAAVYACPGDVSAQLPAILDSMLEAPWAVAGARRLTSELLARGIWAKEGFTGLFVFRLPGREQDVLIAKALSGSDTAVETAVHAFVRTCDPSMPVRSAAHIYPDEVIRNDLDEAVGVQRVNSTLAELRPTLPAAGPADE